MPQTIVTIEDFGPAGNGTSDDQAILQAEPDVAAGGILIFPDASKIYALDGPSLTTHEGTRLINAGAELRLRLRGGAHISFTGG